ncbi:MAG: cysteine desulfurase family protein [Candidatus Saccharibacteria bacterium]|nr:cysteine desulfurase family protein [Candidatus Saccharibacteria bacterium]
MIYLDHAAATPVSEKALNAMLPYFSEQFFNPSAAYLPAVEVRHAYEAAKDEIAHVVGAKGADLVMTSGATESINLAFSLIPTNSDAEVLISAVEHAAVLENAKRCGNYRMIDVDQNGRVLINDFKNKLSSKTQFVSVCLASSELGTIQPIAEIASFIRAERTRRALAGEKTPLYFHCDASQGLGVMEVKLNRLDVDLLTLNAAKVYGPKGIGALYVGHNVRLQPLTVGGGQEMGLRSGTENVPATIGFAAAITDAEKHINSERKRLMELKVKLHRLLEDLPNIKFLGNIKTQLAGFLPICLPGLDAERIIFALEERGICVSTGAACAASKGIKSPTLRAIGLSDEEIAGSLRITMGKLNTEQDIEEFSNNLHEVVANELSRIHK